MDEEERASSKLPKLYDIPLSLIDDFPAHPFKVRMDEDMDQLVESIKEYGLITPVILRTKEPGRYEMISGHRRKIACIRAGYILNACYNLHIERKLLVWKIIRIIS